MLHSPEAQNPAGPQSFSATNPGAHGKCLIPIPGMIAPGGAFGRELKPDGAALDGIACFKIFCMRLGCRLKGFLGRFRVSFLPKSFSWKRIYILSVRMAC
jgi:hypothetical protein